MSTTSLLIESGADLIWEHVSGIAQKPDEPEARGFNAQVHVYADKHNYHLRRTLKLDPVAEFYLYHVIYNNRAHFQRPRRTQHRSFGYQFVQGAIQPPSQSYKAFSTAVLRAAKQYTYTLAFDIACYFNSIYHHDLTRRFADLVDDAAEVALYGRFLRQINCGRSIDCLPHGIAPAKVIGNDFLHFIDSSARIESPVLYRFMDDFVLFSNDETELIADFHYIQDALACRGLFVNSAKTRLGASAQVWEKDSLDPRKRRLLRQRRTLVLSSEGGGDEEEDEDGEDNFDRISAEDTKFLLGLLTEEESTEEDAELVLALLREHADDVLELLPEILRRFPSLSKNVFHYCAHVQDVTELGRILLASVRDNPIATQFQLFWTACTAEAYLGKTALYGDLLTELLEHRSATQISKARVLEIREKRFGMSDRREEQLKSGGSGWMPWAAAIGSLAERRAVRNHALGYFANASELNRLFANVVRRIA